jgi:DNA-binding SARP family transcriptional activator
VHVHGDDETRQRITVRLFGPLTVEDGPRLLGPRDLGGTRPKQVLEILLAARGHRVPTDRVFELLWPDARPQNAAGSVQTFVSVLRRQLTPDRDLARRLIVTEPEAYRAGADLVELDLDRFDELLERSSREPTRRARRSLEEALALVRGEVLEDEPYALWAQDLRNTYRGRVLGARLDAAEAALAERDYADALSHAQAAVALDRFAEHAQRIEMLALYALGRHHEALEAYRRFRAHLDEELGLEPTPTTRALEASILRQEELQTLLPRPIACETPLIDSGPVRLLGRSDELDSLQRAVGDALAGSFALIVVDGETGVGKTRLLTELATSLTGVPVGHAACSQPEQHLPYVPLATALRDVLGRERLASSPHLPLRWVFPELSEDDGREFCEIDGLEALVSLLAEQAPLVLFIDDLQWADASTIAALSYLQRRGSGLPVALIGAISSEEAPPGHPIRQLKPDALVRLAPLTEADLAPLGIPDIHEATGGNPRLVSGVVASDGEQTLTTALSETLLAQCRAAGARAYRILLAASAAEPPFDPEPLADLLEMRVVELVEELERLCERRILRVDGPGFRFRYGLVRDVLRATLSPARERLLRQLQQAAPAPASAAAVAAVRS